MANRNSELIKEMIDRGVLPGSIPIDEFDDINHRHKRRIKRAIAILKAIGKDPGITIANSAIAVGTYDHAPRAGFRGGRGD